MSTLNERIARDVFEEYASLVYAVAWKWCPRMLTRMDRDVPPADTEEYVQDAVCRALNSFIERCKRGLPKIKDRKEWVCQCVMSSVKNACKTPRTFGSPAPQTGYIDALNRRGSIENRAFRHGEDDERDWAMEWLHYVPVQYTATHWEIQELLTKEGVPEHLHKTAIYAAAGLTQEDSAMLQDCTSRTIRNRLRELRDWFNPPVNVYSEICAALLAV